MFSVSHASFNLLMRTVSHWNGKRRQKSTFHHSGRFLSFRQ